MKIYSVTRELTEAEIEGLNTGSPVPLTILSAPPSGKALQVIAGALWKTAGNAATTGTAEIIVSYGSDTNGIIQFTNVDATTGALGNNAQNRIQVATHLSNAVACSGQAVTISANAAIACATGTKAKIKLDFQLIDL